MQSPPAQCPFWHPVKMEHTLKPLYLKWYVDNVKQYTYGASGYAKASNVLHVVREAGAGLGGAAEGVDTLLSADRVAEAVVVDVTDVAFAAGTDAAEVRARLENAVIKCNINK